MTEGSTDSGGTSTGSTSSTTDVAPTTSAADTSSPSTTGDTTTGDGTTTDAITTSESTAGSTGSACLDFSPWDPRNYPEEPHFTCGLEPLCPGEGPLVLTRKNDAWIASDIERARCMAAAMRDRTPGQLRFQTSEDNDFHTLEILGEQVIVVYEVHGLGFGYDYDERVTFLKPPDFFAECSIGTATSIHTCLTKGFTDECADERGCPN